MQEVFGSGLCLQETEGFNDKIGFFTINKNGTKWHILCAKMAHGFCLRIMELFWV